MGTLCLNFGEIGIRLALWATTHYIATENYCPNRTHGIKRRHRCTVDLFVGGISSVPSPGLSLGPLDGRFVNDRRWIVILQ